MQPPSPTLRRALRRLLPALAVPLLFTGCTFSLDRVALPLDTHVAEVGVGLRTVPLSEGWSFVRVAPFWWDGDRILLANVAGVTASRANDGLTLAGLALADSGFGLSAGLLADINGDHVGARLGAVTCGGRQVGAQIGLLNWCTDDSRAVQIGLLNWNGRFWMPLVNVATPAPAAPAEE